MQSINNILIFVFGTRVCLELDMRPRRQLRFVDHALDFPRPGVGPNLVYMAVEGFIFFILAMLLEVCLSN